jgi:hypothetical protein
MPRGSAVDDVEKKLKKRYPGNPGAVFGTLNKIGLKKGSKTTAKGLKPAKPKQMKAAKAKPPKIAKPPRKVKMAKKRKMES